MANVLFDKGRERFLEGQITWTTDDIKVMLVDTGSYTPNFSTHEYKSDVTGGAIIAISGNLSGKTATGGAADANDVTFSAVSGASSEALIIFKDTGTSSTSPLLAYIDTATGLPITPNGGDIIVTFDNGPNKIFKL